MLISRHVSISVFSDCESMVESNDLGNTAFYPIEGKKYEFRTRTKDITYLLFREKLSQLMHHTALQTCLILIDLKNSCNTVKTQFIIV